MATSRIKHVVLFPFPGQGHHASFLTIARLLAHELPDAAITLISTPGNVAALRSSSSFVPGDHGLPVG